MLVSIVTELVYTPINKIWKVSFPTHYLQLLFLFVFLIANLTGVQWNHSVVLIYISFIPQDVEHLFMYLLAIYEI
jgi:hypothetical protein